MKNTAEICHFKILSESAIAAGVRRIDAITSDAVKAYFESKEKTLDEIRGLLKSTGDPVAAVSQLQEENSELRREVESLVKEKSRFLKAELKSQMRSVDGVQLLTARVDLDPAAMKNLAFELGSEYDNLFLLLGADNKGKAVLSCYISKELANQRGLNAGQIVRELGKYIQGGGGGQPFFATAGGKNPSGITEALEAVTAYLK